MHAGLLAGRGSAPKMERNIMVIDFGHSQGMPSKEKARAREMGARGWRDEGRGRRGNINRQSRLTFERFIHVQLLAIEQLQLLPIQAKPALGLDESEGAQ